MCVTNTTYRRSQPIALPQQQAATQPTGEPCGTASNLTQRLMGTFQLCAPAKPQGGFVHQPIACAQPLNNNGGKPRPKRRRKPQKPGKTAKMNDRHFVIHNYHDHSMDSEDFADDHQEEEHSRRKGGVAVAFPLKLHAILDQVERDGLAHVISWQPHGRCFLIHQPKEFVDHVMPKYFRQSKLTSFQRQLNLYGFCRLTRGNDAGAYYHELFLRGKTFLTKRMTRTKVKGTKFKAASSPDQEPDFYAMPPVIVTPHHSPQASPQHQSAAYDSSESVSTAAPLPASAPLDGLYSMFQSNPMVVQQQQQALVQTQPLQQFDAFTAQAQQQGAFMPQQLPQAYEAAPVPYQADQVLDEAVNELFIDPNSAEAAANMNELDDFVRDWEPSNFTETLNNDLTLGFMLDKLMED